MNNPLNPCTAPGAATVPILPLEQVPIVRPVIPASKGPATFSEMTVIAREAFAFLEREAEREYRLEAAGVKVEFHPGRK